MAALAIMRFPGSTVGGGEGRGGEGREGGREGGREDSTNVQSNQVTFPTTQEAANHTASHGAGSKFYSFLPDTLTSQNGYIVSPIPLGH